MTSPATAKNCIAAGATQTSGESLSSGSTKYVTYDATVTEGSSFQTTFRVLQVGLGALFSGWSWVFMSMFVVVGLGLRVSP